MRRLLPAFLIMVAAFPATAATGRVIKVLPHFLDQKGRHAVSPSLYDRDAYQAYLRQHRDECSGLRFDVQWKTKGDPAGPLKLRVELRGIAEGNFSRQRVLEQSVQNGGWFGHWTSIALTGEQFKEFGEVTAWRVSLWENDQVLSEQKSFLW